MRLGLVAGDTTWGFVGQGPSRFTRRVPRDRVSAKGHVRRRTAETKMVRNNVRRLVISRFSVASAFALGRAIGVFFSGGATRFANYQGNRSNLTIFYFSFGGRHTGGIGTG